MKKIFLLSALVFFLHVFLIFPGYTQNQGENSIQGYLCEEDWIEVMFTSESKVRMRNGNLVDLATQALQGTEQVLGKLEWHQWLRLTDLPEALIDEWETNGERNTGKDIYNLNNIYRLQIPKGKDVWKICSELKSLPGVELAMPVPKPMAPPSPPPGSYQSLQGYLYPATNNPSGVDALWSWTQTGGTGSSVTVCDLEYSWNYNHADITKAFGSQINPNPITDPFSNNNHGTAVIGELVSNNNGWGTTGICYGANLKTCGTYWSGTWNVAGAISYAINSLLAGDIILLEQQWDYSNLPSPHPGQEEFIPIEWWGSVRPQAQINNAVYAAIVNAVANGIHVVEAGGNGNNVTGINTGLLTWYGNSGAIIVGAGGATTTNDRQRLGFSSYGSRFDLQGWGENVFTTGYGYYYSSEGVNYYYTSTFSGTSSASPIVAGALACAEGYYLANISSTPPTPSFMRSHLATYGTPQVYGPSGNIGPRPNINSAILNFPTITYDYGDAPQPYPTLLAANGARHANTGLRMGNLIDSESDGQPTIPADGDDINPLISDDEDGVVFTSALVPGQMATLQITVSSGGMLNAWIDFNKVNVWSDPGEFIFQNFSLSPGPNILSFMVPPSALSGYTYARFRFSTNGGILFYGTAPNGEVEDYRVFIEVQEEFDWGDAPDGPYSTLSISMGANHMIIPGMYLGNTVDGEQDGQPDPQALGDDLDIMNPPPNDDEDGVTFKTALIPGQTATIDVVASQSGFFNGWIDFNQLNSWNDPGEQILIDFPLSTGLNTIQFPVPAGAQTGTTFARFRFTMMLGLGFSGFAPDGEVEDYAVIITQGASGNQVDPDPGMQYVQNEISMALLQGVQPGIPAVILAAYNDHPYPGGPGLGVSYSNDGGLTWNPLQLPYPPDPFGGGNFLDAFDPTAAADALGNLYVGHISTDYDWTNGPASGLFVHKSTDGGITWNAPVAVATDIPPSGSPDPNYRFNDRCQMTADVNPASQFYNNLYIVEIKDRGWNNPLLQSDIYFSASTDGGLTWSAQVILNGSQSNMANMPVPAVAPDGTIYVSWLDYNVQTGGSGTIYLDVSTDGGITWLSSDLPVMTIPLPPLNLNGGADVLAKGAPVIHTSPFNSQEIYIVFAAAALTGDEGNIIFIKSTDGGVTWSQGIMVNDDGTNNDQVLPWMDVKPNGIIDVAWYDRRNDPVDLKWEVYMATSTDGGNSFSANQMVSSFSAPSPNTPSGLWMGEYLGLVVDQTHAYMAFTLASPDAKGDIYFNKLENLQMEEMDFGDASDPSYQTLLASNGARHILNGVTFLGVSVDSEFDGQPDPNAMGDDNNGFDDEDGVAFNSPLLAGSPALISVTASGGGLLNLWIDYDGDGTWAQANEQIFTDFGLGAGTHNLNFIVPVNITAGTSYARFRFSNQPALSFTGLASDGEVEDYEVLIEVNPDYKWQQLPNPNLSGLHAHDAVVPPYQSIVIADDWLCSGGQVTDIHWWGSYEAVGSGINYFHLSIHNDNPSGNCLPLDPEIWGMNVPFSSITEQFTGMYTSDGKPINLYEYILPVPFDQIAGNRYWLDITAFSNDPNNQVIWRWQEAQRTYYPILCGAASKIDPGILPWSTIQWNPNPPYMYSDMAFAITSEEFVEELDFGDLPDGPYPTLSSSNGPSHIIGALYLGNLIDAELDGQPDPNAKGDDNTNSDDEEGINFIGGIFPGETSYISVNVSQGNGYLQGWIDYNADGDFNDAGEQIFTNFALPIGLNMLTITANPSASIGKTFARFRISSIMGLGYIGIAPDGEVEDYEVVIRNPVAIWHLDENAGTIAYDATTYNNHGTISGATWTSGFSNSALIFNGSSDYVQVQHSPSLDITGPFSVQAWIKCNGAQQYYAIVDKYEYTAAGSRGFTLYLTGGQLRLSVYSGAAGNGDVFGTSDLRDNLFHHVMGSWDGSYMRVYVDGVLEGSQPWTNAPVSTTQNVGIGMRLSGWGSYMQFSGMIDEVMIAAPTPPEMDYGDAPDPNYPTLFINDGARHILDGITFLGLGVDQDLNGQQDPNAMGDDNNGIDDEDGVALSIFSPPWMPGGIVWIDIVASTGGILNAWVDFDDNGYWGDPGEQIFIDQPLTAGASSFIIGVPVNAQVGKTFGRYRFSTVPGLSFTGAAPDGEVEDYEVTIEGDVDVDLRVFLEGPFIGPNMSTTLNTLGYLPLGQPYNADPLAVWYYNGTESVTAIPNTNINDWVLVEFRDAPSAAAATRATMISMQPAFVLNNGLVVGLDGVSTLKVNGVFQYNPYVVIWHRNHLGVLSASPLVLSGINYYTYDFTTSSGQAYLNGQQNLGGGVYGMYGGDGAPNQLINMADKTAVWAPQVGTKGYKMGDFNLNGHVNNPDKNNVWVPNLGQGTKVP